MSRARLVQAAAPRLMPATAPRRGISLAFAVASAAWAGAPTDPGVTLRDDPGARAVLADIDATEAVTLRQIDSEAMTFGQLVARLGKLMVYDKNLSAGRNEACALCHTKTAGFAGGIAAFNRESGVYPGSETTRFGVRKPMSLAYSTFAPVLHEDRASGRFIGGNFWDSRATGLVTGSPATDQVLTPLVSAFEMALPDPACAVRRVSEGPYAAIFRKIWGAGSLTLAWPRDTDRICARPNDAMPTRTPLPLGAADRARALLSFTQIAQTVSAYEASPFASPFDAEFDRVQSGAANFTPDEAAGLKLFTGRAKCGQCHAMTGSHAVFTDFSSSNIGVPRGRGAADSGLGGFLAGAADPNPAWRAQAVRFMGAFQVPTLRNVGRSPMPGFARAYMHNGSFHDLRDVVHFLNTRDVLPRCTAGRVPGCWPAPEMAGNIDHGLTGNLGLTSLEEAQIVAFLGTLSDAS